MLFKRKNARGNYPKPRNLTRSEKDRRKKYNFYIIMKELYVPNKRIEELIGMELTSPEPHINRKITDAEANELVELVSKEIAPLRLFRDLWGAECEEYWQEWKKNSLKRSASLVSGEMCEEEKLDDSIYSIPYMRNIYKKAIAKASVQELEKSTAEIEELRREIAARPLDEKVENINTTLKVLSSFLHLFLSCEAVMMTQMGVNFYGASVPLYEIY